MKHIERIIGTIGMIGLLALSLSSCSNEEPINGGSTSRELIVSAEIASSDANSQTRAAASGYEKTAFNDNDQISIYNKGSESNKVLYKKSGTRWLPVSTALTVAAKAETYNAFYPSDFANIEENQTVEGAFAKSNKLEASETTTATGNSVNFRFVPAFCKMTVTVTYGDTQSNVTATLEGDGVCQVGGGKKTIKMLRTTGNTAAKTHTFICIFQPGTRAYTLAVNSSSANTFSGTSKVFKAGYNYIYTFTSSNDLILTGVKVESFGVGGTIDVGSAT